MSTDPNQLLAHMSVGVMMHDLAAVARPVASALVGEVWKSFTGALHSLGEGLGLTSGAHRKVQETDKHLIARMAASGANKAQITKALEARSANKAALFEMLVEDGTNRPGEDVGCLEELQTVQYRARPLNGIWSTGPFLHNGSVPNLTSLLEAPANRPVTFNTGSPRIDAEKVGFMDVADTNTMKFDTRKPGNSNAGHLYGVKLKAADKTALLEYLKSL
ncbi:MAG: hypothetical protein HOK21_16765 [Rhodospirillaceae bacterium]|jgi:hypothetical protein|nr:hypothetical protein [Rhodospirillaceae bacterium]MBT4688296.1 hypothetical protein [Rhodospirillaceae bacterium]MBT5079289.1 hypothetical protein [Rhodospirillaceae bacterium]MBT5525739.1 hypothetical protein [Rhodospirillaceae bacterium]MBT5879319.1 hypothetical protein [Rhodospirillaceae bacterium]